MKFLTVRVLLIIANAYLAMAVLYAGTLCGWAELTTFHPIKCNQHDPRFSCPMNYTRKMLKERTSVCYKLNTTYDGEYGLPGTICGGLAGNPCGGLNPSKECPKGYIQGGPQICYKNDPEVEDVSGTFCGYFFEGTGSSCNTLPLGECPNGYIGINFPTKNSYMCRDRVMNVAFEPLLENLTDDIAPNVN